MEYKQCILKTRAFHGIQTCNLKIKVFHAIHVQTVLYLPLDKVVYLRHLVVFFNINNTTFVFNENVLVIATNAKQYNIFIVFMFPHQYQILPTGPTCISVYYG